MLDKKSAPFSHAVIFGFMETEAAEITDGSQCFSFIISHNTLSGIFNNQELMPPCYIHNGIHFTAYPGIMNRHNGFCLFGNGRLDQGFIYIHGIRTDIHKYRHCPTEHKGVRRGYECKGRHNDLISRPHLG